MARARKEFRELTVSEATNYGRKVLAVDFDSQSNLTTCFGAGDVDIAIGDLMMAVIEDEDLPERDEYIWESQDQLEANIVSEGLGRDGRPLFP